MRWECTGCGGEVEADTPARCVKCGGGSYERLMPLEQRQSYIERVQAMLNGEAKAETTGGPVVPAMAKPPAKRKGRQPRAVVCVETGKRYAGGAEEASRDVGCHPSAVSRAAKNGTICNGKHWRFEGAASAAPKAAKAPKASAPAPREREAGGGIGGGLTVDDVAAVVAALQRTTKQPTQADLREALGWYKAAKETAEHVAEVLNGGASLRVEDGEVVVVQEGGA